MQWGINNKPVAKIKWKQIMTEWGYEKYGTTKRACPWLIGSWWFLTQQKIFKNKNKHVQTMTNFVGIIENVYLELYVGIVSLRRPKC